LLAPEAIIVAAPAGLQLAVLGSGVRLPVVETAEVAPAPVEQPVADTAPAVPIAPTVPVYPRKQARH